MKPELTLLVWSVALAFAQMLIAASAATLQVGLPMLAGNRDSMPPLTGWAGRAERAHLNMLESLVLFAALILFSSGRGSSTRSSTWPACLGCAPACDWSRSSAWS